MEIFITIIMIGLAYLSGSLPIGYIVARVSGVDVLQSGSGKTGATNVLRSAGLMPAALTVLGDAFKGLIPTWIAVALATNGLMPFWGAALVGAATVVGHNYSIFLKFKGGVGAVTALASLGAFSLQAGFVAVFVAIAIIAITRYASMGSFISSLTGLFMLIILGLGNITPTAYVLYSALVVLLVGYALRPNFARIIAGTERKIGVKENNVTTMNAGN
ncbi:MAG: hypothetical protein B6242_00160 [Anaerolineaceae bacterium 4572_78]|nr:MAG: hypothetical protein B6242_00160 [Anaerolineaceae bacterium 4572_78]